MKALISFVVIPKLICAFVCQYAKTGFLMMQLIVYDICDPTHDVKTIDNLLLLDF